MHIVMQGGYRGTGHDIPQCSNPLMQMTRQLILYYMEISEKDKEFLPRLWRSYTRLADIARTENYDFHELICEIAYEFNRFNNCDINHCCFMHDEVLTSRLYDFLVSENILTIETGDELQFSLTEYGDYFRKFLNKEMPRIQKSKEWRLKKKEDEERRKKNFIKVFVLCLSFFSLGVAIATLLINCI